MIQSTSMVVTSFPWLWQKRCLKCDLLTLYAFFFAALCAAKKKPPISPPKRLQDRGGTLNPPPGFRGRVRNPPPYIPSRKILVLVSLEFKVHGFSHFLTAARNCGIPPFFILKLRSYLKCRLNYILQSLGDGVGPSDAVSQDGINTTIELQEPVTLNFALRYLTQWDDSSSVRWI